MAVINIRGVIVHLILEIYPYFYGLFVTIDKKGKKVIIVKCLDAIYLIMVASLIYYKKSVKSLKSTGFQINPCGPFVSNNMEKDKQQTISFRVDNCKIVHQDREVNDEFIHTVCDEYESLFEYGYVKMKVI